jgi:hypothetical protein
MVWNTLFDGSLHVLESTWRMTTAGENLFPECVGFLTLSSLGMFGGARRCAARRSVSSIDRVLPAGVPSTRIWLPFTPTTGASEHVHDVLALRERRALRHRKLADALKLIREEDDGDDEQEVDHARERQIKGRALAASRYLLLDEVQRDRVHPGVRPG